MPCTHCGRGARTERYPLRFDPPDGAPTTIDLDLCEECRDALLAENDVSLAGTAERVYR